MRRSTWCCVSLENLLIGFYGPTCALPVKSGASCAEIPGCAFHQQAHRRIRVCNPHCPPRLKLARSPARRGRTFSSAGVVPDLWSSFCTAMRKPVIHGGRSPPSWTKASPSWCLTFVGSDGRLVQTQVTTRRHKLRTFEPLLQPSAMIAPQWSLTTSGSWWPTPIRHVTPIRSSGSPSWMHRFLASHPLQPGPLEPRRSRPLRLPASAAFLSRGAHWRCRRHAGAQVRTPHLGRGHAP